MAQKPVGPSGSGAGRANALSNFEARPASPPSHPHGAACTLEAMRHGIVQWHFRAWPHIATMLEALELPLWILREVAPALGDFLETVLPLDERRVAKNAEWLLSLPSQRRLIYMKIELKLVPGARGRLLVMSRSLEGRLKIECPPAEEADVVSAIQLANLVGAAAVLTNPGIDKIETSATR